MLTTEQQAGLIQHEKEREERCKRVLVKYVPKKEVDEEKLRIIEFEKRKKR